MNDQMTPIDQNVPNNRNDLNKQEVPYEQKFRMTKNISIEKLIFGKHE